MALAALAEIADVRADEQPDGSVTVFVGGDFLVFQGQSRQVKSTVVSSGGVNTTSIVLDRTNAPLDLTSGKLAGLMTARDDILGGFLTQLDTFASTLVFEFNKVYSSGQGLRGYQQLTSEREIASTTAALDSIGLPFTPVNGSFQVQVFDKQSNLTQTTDIFVDLDGLDADTTLADLTAALNAVNGISATLAASGRMTISSDSTQQEYTFANDTSGVLAALGIATFFTGSRAADIAINQETTSDPARFAASASGIGEDTKNAEVLAGFSDLALDSAGGSTLSTLYDRLAANTTQGSAVARSVAEGFRVFEETLRGEQLGLSGVSLDEEAVRLITFQRAYQAAAKYISIVSDLLDVLVNL